MVLFYEPYNVSIYLYAFFTFIIVPTFWYFVPASSHHIFVCNFCPGLLIHYSNNEYLLISTILSDNLEPLFISKTKQMSPFYFYMLFAEPQLSFWFEILRLSGTIGLNTRKLIFPTHKPEVEHCSSMIKFFLKSTPKMPGFEWTS